MRPAIASFLRHYVDASVGQEHGPPVLPISLLFDFAVPHGRRPCEAHDAPAAQADADDAVAESIEQVYVRRYAFARSVEVHDGLPGAGRATWQWEEQFICLCREQGMKIV